MTLIVGRIFLKDTKGAARTIAASRVAGMMAEAAVST
jgi:hypothetical protein